MKKLACLVFAFFVAVSFLAGQGAKSEDADRAAVAQAALNYAEGYYEGNAARMEQGVSPALTKRGLMFSPRSGASFLRQMNAEMLIEATRAGGGKLPAAQRQIEFQLLDISGNTASARIFTARFKDLLHLAKQNGQWRIVSVLWRPPAEKETPNKETEKEAIRMQLEEFREAMRGGNYERLTRILHPTLALRLLAPTAEPGRMILVEQNADSLIDRVRAGAGGAISDYRISVQELYEDIAAVKVASLNTVQYLHLVKEEGQWRILNMLFEPPGPAGAHIQPAVLGEKMADFTLTSIQGQSVSIAGLKGKNVLIVFPRGRVDDHWCQLCHYQYAELADLEKRLQLRKKYNLEILFVLPYDRATVQHWVDIFPEQMAVIEGWKNPANPAQLRPAQKEWMEITRRALPKKFDIQKGSIPTPFPILIDGERTVSRGLDLFTLLWDNSKAEQNVPAVYLLDRQGKVRFKYLSQNTMDRPSADYLQEVLRKFADR